MALLSVVPPSAEDDARAVATRRQFGCIPIWDKAVLMLFDRSLNQLGMPYRGVFAGHPLWHQLLSSGKVAEYRAVTVLTRPQQAQGKHAKECRGAQPGFCRLFMVDSLLPTALLS
jgi:hypothetical protein